MGETTIYIYILLKLLGGGIMGTEKSVGVRTTSQNCQHFRAHVRNQSLEMRLLQVALKVRGKPRGCGVMGPKGKNWVQAE